MRERLCGDIEVRGVDPPEEMETVAATAQEDAAGARKAYGKLLRDYGGIKRLKTELRKIIKELPKE